MARRVQSVQCFLMLVCRYLRENHNSVLGVREYALERGGTFLVSRVATSCLLTQCTACACHAEVTQRDC